MVTHMTSWQRNRLQSHMNTQHSVTGECGHYWCVCVCVCVMCARMHCTTMCAAMCTCMCLNTLACCLTNLEGRVATTALKYSKWLISLCLHSGLILSTDMLTTFSIDSIPTLQAVKKLIVREVAADWSALAIHLGLDSSVIKMPETDHPRHCERSCIAHALVCVCVRALLYVCCCAHTCWCVV